MLNKDKLSINSARDRKKGESQEGRETKRKGRGKVNIFCKNVFFIGGQNGKYKFFNMLKWIWSKQVNIEDKMISD